jgi:DNA modification methylase
MNSIASKPVTSQSYRNIVLPGNCIDVMRQFNSESVDFVLTDPPYVKSYRSRDGRMVRNDNNFAWLKPAFEQLYRILKPHRFCVCFYGWAHAEKFLEAFCHSGFRIAGHLSFPKRYISGKRYLAYQHEAAYLLAKGEPTQPQYALADVIEWRDYPKNELHPTQKPLSVLTPLIKAFSRPGDLVLDPFCGSGSTLLAAKIKGRAFVGVELDPSYFEIARSRLGSKAA